MRRNYREQDGCHNCEYVEKINEHDEGTRYYCNNDLSERPLCGSVLMKEYFGDGVAFDAQADKWDRWCEGREVKAVGTCDHHRDRAEGV